MGNRVNKLSETAGKDDSQDNCNFCTLRNDQIAFKKRPKVAKTDHLSSLDHDCLLSVFSFLNEDDLCKLSPVNQKLNTFVNRALVTPARTNKFGDIQLKQCPNGDFAIVTGRPYRRGQILRILCTADNIFQSEDEFNP
ncbi:hypothetical protein PMAYCL1PPCAC_22215, partial [Pristionchus mayeri]